MDILCSLITRPPNAPCVEKIRVKYFVHKLSTNVNSRVSLEVCSLSWKKSQQTSCFAEKPRMSGSHLGIRFEVSAKLACALEDPRHLILKLLALLMAVCPCNLSTCCRKFMNKARLSNNEFTTHPRYSCVSSLLILLI